MSRNGTLLPADPAFIEERVAMWTEGAYQGLKWPRSVWLRDFEVELGWSFPQSSSADRKLTARHYAPFPLRDGHDVP